MVEHRLRFLGVVLLLCTHGINLGRTQFYWKGDGVELAELVYMFLEWTWVVRRSRGRACV